MKTDPFMPGYKRATVMSLACALILLLMTFFWTPRACADWQQASFSCPLSEGPAENLFAEGFDIDVEIRYTIGTLMGEPVANAQARYQIGPFVYIDGKSYPVSKFPAEVLSQARINDLVIALPFSSTQRYQISTSNNKSPDLFVDIDMGALKAPGEEWSYNVPGSPNWDHWLYYDRTSPKYLNKVAAVAVYKGHKDDTRLSFYRSIRKISYDVSVLKNWLQLSELQALTVRTEPADATVKVLNIKPVYTPGMRLKSGDYHIRVEKQGYESVSRWISLGQGQGEFNITLKRKRTQTDEFEAMLEATEAPAAHQTADLDDLFADSEAPAPRKMDLEAMLDKTEQVELVISSPPARTSDNVITISGLVKNASSIGASSVTFLVNGLLQPVALDDNGSFRNKVVLFHGDNLIDIDYRGVAQKVHRQFKVHSTTAPVKARFTLVWDAGGSDMDLHVYGPGEQHCYYGRNQTATMVLDVDNRSGYGPENISVKLARSSGTYEIYVRHYGGHSSGVTLYVYLDNRLVATENNFLSGNEKWHAYTLDLD